MRLLLIALALALTACSERPTIEPEPTNGQGMRPGPGPWTPPPSGGSAPQLTSFFLNTSTWSAAGAHELTLLTADPAGPGYTLTYPFAFQGSCPSGYTEVLGASYTLALSIKDATGGFSQFVPTDVAPVIDQDINDTYLWLKATITTPFTVLPGFSVTVKIVSVAGVPAPLGDFTFRLAPVAL